MAQNRYRNWKEEDFQDYCEKHHKGRSRGQVKKEEQKIYLAMWRRNILGKVFPPKNCDNQNPKPKGKLGRPGPYLNFSLEDFQNLCNQKYLGKGRTEIFHENRKFYDAVLRRKWSDKVFPPKRSTGQKIIKKSLVSIIQEIPL